MPTPGDRHDLILGALDRLSAGGATNGNVGNFSWDTVRSLAADSRGSDPWSYRAEFLDLVDRARRLTSSDAPLAVSE